MNPGSFCGSCGAVVKQGALYCGSCGAPAAAPSVSTPVPPPTMIGTIGGGPDGYAPGVSAPGYAGPPADGGGQPGFPGSGDPAQLGFVGYASFGRRVG
ncbi:MAG TPA: zinc-ribbon domain-containing protein, partial [Nakamurella sp.]